MGKYLKLFNQAAEYKAFKESEEYILPNVSFVESDNVICYNPFETVKPSVIMAHYNATEDNMLALADTSNVKSLKVNGENIVFEPVQITNKSFEVIGSNIVVNEDGTGEYPDEYMHFFSEGTPIKITIKLKDDSLNIADFNCFSVLGKHDGEDVKRCDILLIKDAINDGLLSFDKTNNALIFNASFNGCNAVGLVLGNVDVEQEMWVPVFVDTVNEMEIKAGGIPEMYYFNEVGEYDVEIELIDPTLINGTRYDEDENPISNTMFFDDNEWIGACLTSVVIPDSVTSIGKRAFCYCIDLTEVHIGSGVTTIEREAFRDCSGLTSINIPDSVTYIGNEAFRDCSGLTSIVIPDSVTTIESYAFYSCSGLTSIVIPDSDTNIGDDAFGDCTSLPVENNLRYADTYLVEVVDKSLSTYTIKEGTKWIGNEAFFNCSRLTSINIPDSVTSIGWGAFLGCISLPVENSIRYADTYLVGVSNNSLSTYTIKEGTKWIGSSAFSNCSRLTSINIPDSVTEIGYQAFYVCKNLTSINIPDSVTSIGSEAFYSCSGLTSINIPDSVTSIGYGAFDSCSGLTSIVIPDSVTSIGNHAFNKCSRLTSVHIGSGVTSIGDYAFMSCSSLTSIVVSESNTVYDSRENCNCIIETATNTLIIGCNNSFIPDSVTTIGRWAFAYCEGLTSIVIPDSVTKIRCEAFRNCSSLKEITCNAITPPMICENTFNEVAWSGKLNVPEGADYSSWLSTREGYLGYYNWTYLQYIICTYNVTDISQATPIIFGYSLSNYSHMFVDGVKMEVQDYYQFDTVGEHTVTFSLLVSDLENIFYNCPNLTSVIIPDSVTSIGDYAFSNCTSLSEIICEAPTALTIYNSTFQDVKEGGVLKVPVGSDYSSWLSTGDYYLGKYNWTVEYI